MNINSIDDEATARKLLNCIVVACGFKSAWLSWGSGFLNYIKFERKDGYAMHDVFDMANIVVVPIKSSTCVKAVKELLNRLDKQGQILLRDSSFDEHPICWLKREDVFDNDMLKFEAALMGVELNG